MSEETIVDANRIAELEEEVGDLKRQNERLRGTQSSLTKTGEALKAQLTEKDDVIGQLQAERDEFKAKISGMEQELAKLPEIDAAKSELEGRVDSLTAQEERLRKVIGMSTEHPILATLAKNGALPDADGIEEFEEKLLAIAEDAGSIVRNTATAQIAGAKPSAPSQANSQLTAEQLYRQSKEAMLSGNVDEALSLIEKAKELE